AEGSSAQWDPRPYVVEGGTREQTSPPLHAARNVDGPTFQLVRLPLTSRPWPVPRGRQSARSLTAEEWQERTARTRRFFGSNSKLKWIVRRDGLSFLSESLILAQDKRWRRA